MSDNVKQFPGVSAELPENPLMPDSRHLPFCQHESVRLDDHARTVVCVKCGATLDAFDFLRTSARTIQSAWSNHRFVTAELAQRREQLDSLKKEEKRLRAVVKRLQQKGAETIVGREIL